MNNNKQTKNLPSESFIIVSRERRQLRFCCSFGCEIPPIKLMTADVWWRPFNVSILYLGESGDPLNTPTQGSAVSLRMVWLYKVVFD